MTPFEARRRALARASLYTSLLLVLAGAVLFHRGLERPAVGEADMTWWDTDYPNLPEVRLLQQYLRLDSSPGGDEYAAALWLAGPLAAAGVPVQIERVGESHANLWARIEGRRPESLILLSHLDVEPAEAIERWEIPPFSGRIVPPYIHGRGSFDMKSYTVAQLMAFLDVAANPEPPEYSVLFMATSAEEQGSDLGIRWLLREHPELFEEVFGVLTEGGLLEARSLWDAKYWGVEFGQKRFLRLVACSGSRQRLEDLRTDLLEFGLTWTELELLPQVARFWRRYGPTRDRAELRNALADPELVLRDTGALARLPAYLTSMLRNEAVPFSVQASESGGWELPITLHILPGADVDLARAQVLPDWLLAGVTLAQIDPGAVGGESPLDHPLFQAIQDQLDEEYPLEPSGPFFLPWTMTDARFLRPRGIPVYGFSPFFILTPDTLRIGDRNEKIGLPGFVAGVATYREVVGRLTR